MKNEDDIPELAEVEIEPVGDDAGPASNISAPLSQSQPAPSSTSPSGPVSSPSQPQRQAAPNDPLLGVRLKDTYELTAKIGEGGMGNVYSAIQYPLERKVAVKVLKPTDSNPEGEHYFMREVQAINKLRHPNIVNIVDYGKERGGMLYLVMEHLPGKTLKEVIKREFPIKPTRICEIIIQLLGALESAHDSEIVHCDLKPANIMVEKVAGQPDFVKILDFGIAKVKGPAMEAGPYTQAGNIVGTFDYMSPEQIMRKDLDGRADIWSTGVILYEMLTRKRLFHDKDAVSIIGRVMQMPIRPPSELAPDVPIPANLERVTLRAMERNKKKRYQTAKEMRDALKQVLKELESGNTTGTTGVHSTGPHSGSLAASGLVQGGRGGPSQTGPVTTGTSSATGLSSLYTRSGSFGSFGGTEHSQRLADSLAKGTSILDETFGAGELEGGLAGERRKVAILAIQQRSRRSAGIDPEELARRSAEEKRIIQKIVAHYEGELDSQLGGTFTILFGARRARVGDNVRAAECALALRDKFRSLDQGADHIGIALVYGEVYIANRKGGNAYGEAIDRAVEIARSGRNAAVQADKNIRDATRDQVDYQGGRQVAGTEVAEVVAVSARTAGKEEEKDLAEIDIFVPRPTYFDELMRRAAAAKKKQGGGIAILGDMGTGKSVLLDRFSDKLKDSGWRTFVARESGMGGQFGLAPIRSWIRQIASSYKDPAKLIRRACESIGLKKHIDAVLEVYLGQGDKKAEEIGELPWNDASGYAHFTGALLYRMLRFAMKKGPVMLAIDDIAVADQFTVQFIDSLLSGIQKQPILITVTLRIESSALDHGLPGNFEILQLGSFSADESKQYIAQVLGYTPQPDVVQQVHQRSSGNPMFLNEMVRTVLQRSGGKLSSGADLLDADIPTNLQELLGARVDALPDQARDLLAVASVIGESFREDFFYQITPSHLEPESNLKTLVALNFMAAEFDHFERIHLAFQPRTLRQVVYDRLPKSTRKQLHSRIIEFLEQAGDYAAVDPLEYPLMIAFHYRSVEGWEGAAYYLTIAGEMLLDLYDYAGAIDQLQEAVELLTDRVEPNNETLVIARSRLLVALRESGRLEDARDVVEKLPDLAGQEPKIRRELLYECGLIALEGGRLDRARKLLEQARELAQEFEDPKAEVNAMLGIAQVYEKENQLPRAAHLLQDVSQRVGQLGELNMQDPDDRKLFWTAYNQLGTLFIRQKDYQRAQQFLQAAYEQARAIEDFRGLVRVMSNFGALSLSMRDVDRATNYFENAANFAESTGDLLNQSRILTNLGITALEAGNLKASKGYFKKARSIAEEIGWYEGLAELSLHIKKLRKALR